MYNGRVQYLEIDFLGGAVGKPGRKLTLLWIAVNELFIMAKLWAGITNGFIIFEGAHWNDEAWVRLCLHDGGWISSLEHKKPKLNDTEMGHCYEIAYFARLKETATDCKIIQRTTDIKKYATLNEDDPAEPLFYNPIEDSLIWKDLPIVWA